MLSDNEKYQQMKLVPGTVVPEMRDDYPTDDPVTRLYKPVYDREFVCDENYPFYETGWKNALYHKFAYAVILRTALRILLHVQDGIRWEGRENLKKYKKELSGGFITLGNHCHRHDCEAILLGVGARSTTRIPMFAKNFETKDAPFMWMVGGVPIPPAEYGLSAMKKFNSAFDQYHEEGASFHVFPEAAKWDYYKPMRPFQKGAFTMAYKYNMPLIPCTITWRKRTGIWRLFGDQKRPLMTVKIGEPVFPDLTAPRKTEVERLRAVCHKTMCDMAGIIENPWPVCGD